MANLAINPNDIVKARESGYSDAEIATFLSDKAPEQFKSARAAGYNDTEILTHLSGASEAPSGVVAGLKQGLANVIHGPAETLKTFGGVDTSRAEKVAKATAPDNYKAAPIVPENGHWYDPTSYNWKNVPQAVAENAPAMAETIAAAKIAGKIHPLAGLAAGAGVFAANALGDTAKTAAVNRTGDQNAEANDADKTRAGLTVAAQSIPQAIGLTRFLPGAGKVAAVGNKGVAQSVGQAAITTGVEGATGAAQDAVGQAGLTVGTDKGLTIDPNQVANAGVTNGIVGGLAATPKMLASAAASKKYAKFGGDNQEAATAFANRASTIADGADLGNTKEGFNAVRGAHENVLSELKVASKANPNLPLETTQALERATKGRTLTDADLSTITDNATPDVAALARQAHVGALLKEKGDFGKGKFVGGMANAVGKHIRAIQNPVGAAGSAALGATIGGAHAASLFAYSPQTLGAIAAAYGVMRGADALTGSRSPAKGFVDRFADPSVSPSPSAPAPLAAPQAPTSTSVPQVPRPGAPAQPWGASPSAPAPTPPLNASAVQADIKGLLLKESARRKMLEAQAAPPEPSPAAPPAPPPMNANALNADVRGLLLKEAARRKAQGAAQADAIAEDSHLINDQGGVDALSNPALGKRAKELLGAATALKKLRAPPPAKKDEVAAYAQLEADHARASAPDATEALVNKARGKVTLSPKEADTSSDADHFNLEANGKVIGNTRLRYDPETKVVEMEFIGRGDRIDDGGAQSLGHSAMRQVFREIADRYPDAERVEGQRMSGARGKSGALGETGFINLRSASPAAVPKQKAEALVEKGREASNPKLRLQSAVMDLFRARGAGYGFDVPQAPEIIHKITKAKDGEVKEKTKPAPKREPDHLDADETFDPETGEIIRTGHEEANAGPKYTSDYVPLESHELFGKGWDNQKFADNQLAKKRSEDPNVHEQAYVSKIMHDRTKRERTLQDVTRDHATGPEDIAVAKELLEQLHHIRRGEVAAKAVRHYASFMSPKLRAATLKRLDTSFLNSMWSK